MSIDEEIEWKLRRANEQITALEAQNARLVEALEAVRPVLLNHEFTFCDGVWYCPVCRNWKGDGHEPDCSMGKALRACGVEATEAKEKP